MDVLRQIKNGPDSSRWFVKFLDKADDFIHQVVTHRIKASKCIVLVAFRHQEFQTAIW